MGINLGNLIPRKQIKLEDLSGRKIAVDSSNMLYQFLSSIRQRDGTLLMDKHGNVTSHLLGLLTRSTNLMEKGLQLAFVFDGKMPDMKYSEIIGREQRKIEAEQQYLGAREREDKESMYKLSMRTARLTKTMVDEAKLLIKALGMPVIQAIQEADAQAAYMCQHEDVWAVASSDMDTLLHNSTRMLPNLTLSQKRKTKTGIVYTSPELIELKEVLKELDINQDQLIALGILVGTDYNPGGVHGIGPKKALKLVKETNKLDEIFKKANADFDWLAIYNLFKTMPKTKDYQLKWNKPDADAVKSLLVDKHDFSEERVESVLSRVLKESNKRQQSSLNKWS